MGKQNKPNLLEEIKRYWMIFLLFGIISAGISAGVSTYVSTKITENLKGPPCRIDFATEKFPMTNSTNFKLQYLFINLRDKELLLEGFDNYCLWRNIEEEKEISKENVLIQQPITKEIDAPSELEKMPASQSQINTAYCKSPDKAGLYKIKVVGKTTIGNCEGEILMEVVEK